MICRQNQELVRSTALKINSFAALTRAINEENEHARLERERSLRKCGARRIRLSFRASESGLMPMRNTAGNYPLWSAPGVLITPHVAASTPLSLKRVARLVREQAESYMRGDALRNVITDAY